ncbi:phosphatidylinositol-binding protein scs2 [Aspergillus alliaceus]|uniref:PapD-like protein n=1 Tax=Petromyces alliaceus TaxID=209559 RepID=A0A5N6GBK2_PETAA|nr:PapD-like protein [Aspergillus alliaceus]KAB8239841.1 PapD-like protein [Aspergillus alliaceus]KAE8390622.1 PapD-like protein [Aspergillus alliaceus]KAF5856294.1 phosphatidylinositol-binding protein scs2 [Aspergillus burnettii]
MSIILDPPELGFKRPFNREVCQVLHLNNDNQEPVVFKVKTTAPKHYCVRPNSGRIEPGRTVDVQVLLQAMKEEPTPDAKCKDKFLVQTVAVTRDMEFANVTSIFEKASKASIQERKIRVNWLSAEESPAVEQGDTNGVNAQDDEPPAYTSPAANFQTPAVGAASKVASDTSPIPPPDFSDKRDIPTPQATESTTSSAKAAIASAIPTSGEDLSAQLAEAKAQIQKLKDRLSDQGLRQRKIGGETEKSATPGLQQQQHAQSVEPGVPVQVVAGLCLLSFLIAYFFF